MVTGKKKILVFGINYSPELTGIGKYTGEMIDWLVQNQYDVTLITGFPYYPYWKVQQPYSGKWYKKEVNKEGGLLVYRCPLYVPEEPTGFKRLIHEFSFFISAFIVTIIQLFKAKNEIIFAIAPPFHLGFLALFYRFFKGGKIIYHIQDLQVDAAKELKMLPNGLFSVLFALERFILKKADFVSTISEGMRRRIFAKTEREILIFPNWVDTENFYPLNNRNLLKPDWGFNPDDKIVLYSGSIGEKQGLDAVVFAAKQLKAFDKIKFIICGTGPYKDKLIAMVEASGLSNVFFLPLQSSERFNKFLNMADVHLILQKGDASDLVMPSKLTTILSVGGLALVTAHEGTTLNDVIKEHAMGVVIKPDNDELLKEAILKCCAHEFSDERTNARAYAEKHLNGNSILHQLMIRLDNSLS